jgi:hypothetical protein
MAISRWFYLSQVIVQRLTLGCLLGLAMAATLWVVAAFVGLVPWLEIPAQFGGRQVDAGAAVQLAGALLLVGLCFFVPMNDRVLRLENSHRVFRVTMRDVAHAYHLAHAADREGVFALKSEFDSVRERFEHLRAHPDLGKLEPELLEIAAQMSHESRELAEVYSDERVERARNFLRQRQEEVEMMRDRMREANSACHELKHWLARVEEDEETARQEVVALKVQVMTLFHDIETSPMGRTMSDERFGPRTVAAE